MQQIIKNISLILFFLLGTITFATAQKYGHMNLGNLLSDLPQVKAADAELETYRKQLLTKGEQMAKAFEAEYQRISEAAQDMAPVQIQEAQEKLSKQQQDILAYEQEVTQKVTQKRQELLAPILQKVENAVKALAEEEGYEMIFDTSIFNAVLFAKESEDVLEKVKLKLQ